MHCDALWKKEKTGKEKEGGEKADMARSLPYYPFSNLRSRKINRRRGGKERGEERVARTRLPDYEIKAREGKGRRKEGKRGEGARGAPRRPHSRCFLQSTRNRKKRRVGREERGGRGRKEVGLHPYPTRAALVRGKTKGKREGRGENSTCKDFAAHFISFFSPSDVAYHKKNGNDRVGEGGEGKGGEEK